MIQLNKKLYLRLNPISHPPDYGWITYVDGNGDVEWHEIIKGRKIAIKRGFLVEGCGSWEIPLLTPLGKAMLRLTQ